MRGPWRRCSLSISCSAAGVALTRRASDMASAARRPGSEEPERLRRVAHQQILGLLIVIEHHLVRLAADARLLVTAEGGMRGVGVVAVGPDAPGLDGPTHAVARVGVPRPHTGAEAIKRVVGDLQSLGLVLEGRDGHHRTED